MTKGFRWSKKDTTRKHILAGVVYLLGQYGFEHRDVLLKGFLFIAGLLENVNMFEHSENTLSGHVATDTTAELTYEVLFCCLILLFFVV